MPTKSKRRPLQLSDEEKQKLEKISSSRSESFSSIERAKILLLYSEGKGTTEISRLMSLNRPKIDRTIKRALDFGVMDGLKDRKRTGKPANITDEAKAWITALACSKPSDYGLPQGKWTHRFLAKYIRENCNAQGHSCLSNLVSGTISKILSANELKPHKTTYYLEKKDPQFDQKMQWVLSFYKEVEMVRESNSADGVFHAYLSYDEKPGIQAIEGVSRDLPPVPGKYETTARDYEYKRHGTFSLMGGIDLITGKIHYQIVDRHRSREFVDYLKLLDQTYPKGHIIKLILDNHSAHKSKETKAYLSTVPNRFDFTFTPVHGSWLNLIESFFSKITRAFLKDIRVSSKDELKQRLSDYLELINKEPVVFKWKYLMDEFKV